MSKNSPITITDRWFQGEDKRLDWRIVDDAGNPKTCTGYQLLWELFTEQGPLGTVLISKDSVANEITLYNANGVDDGVRVAINDTDTITQATPGVESIQPGTYWYELWKTDEGDEQLLASGTAVLQASRRRQEVT